MLFLNFTLPWFLNTYSQFKHIFYNIPHIILISIEWHSIEYESHAIALKPHIISFVFNRHSMQYTNIVSMISLFFIRINEFWYKFVSLIQRFINFYLITVGIVIILYLSLWLGNKFWNNDSNLQTPAYILYAIVRIHRCFIVIFYVLLLLFDNVTIWHIRQYLILLITC